MRQYFMTGAVLVVCTMVFAVALAADNAEFEKAKARSQAVADGLQSYEIHAKLIMDQKPKGAEQGMKLEAAQTAAARMPDRLVVKVESTMFNQSWGTGEAGSWFNLPQNNAVYQGAPVTLRRTMDDSGSGEFNEDHFYNFYIGVGEYLLTSEVDVAPVTRRESITANGQPVDCQVFEFKITAEDGVTEQGYGAYWFDPASGLVLKSSITTLGNQGGMEMERTMDLTVTNFTLNGEVSDDLFTFTTPPQAKVVDSFEKLMNPDSMVGESAPDISFTTLEGETINIRDYRGKVVFLDFWATWCGPCRMEMPHLEKLHKELKSRGDVVFIGASNEDQKTIVDWLAKNPYTFQIVRTNPQDAQGKYKVTSIPAGFVIDAEGVIQAHLIGAQSEEQLRAALAKAGVKE